MFFIIYKGQEIGRDEPNETESQKKKEIIIVNGFDRAKTYFSDSDECFVDSVASLYDLHFFCLFFLNKK